MELKLTPMIQQYRRIKKNIPKDAILMFRLGDFYEMFFEDAVTASKILNIALTKRSRIEGRDYPMCGIPYHAAESYIGRLIKKGIKVAVCDQVEDPKLAKGIVKREVTRLITPGTIMDDKLLDEKRNNYLVSFNRIGKIFGLSSLDLSTGEFKVAEISTEEDFFSEFLRIGPAECILPVSLKGFLDKIKSNGNMLVNYYDDWVFDYENCYIMLKEHFKTHSLDGYGCQGLVPGITSAGAMLYYLKENLNKSLGQIQRIVPYRITDHMILDNATIRNLELIESQSADNAKATLLGVLDYTDTNMGARLMREWIKNPLINVEQIKQRQDAVRFFYENNAKRNNLKGLLKGIQDVLRITGRINSGYANPRDLAALKDTLGKIPDIRKQLEEIKNSMLEKLLLDLKELPEIVDELSRALMQDPPYNMRDGGFIKNGYNAELDELRNISTEAKGWLTNLQAKEIDSTGIKSLKIRYNRVFGYYIEVSNSNLSNIPGHYTRKQTLVNAERFITPELKEYESKILNAKEQLSELENRIFTDLCNKVSNFTVSIQNIAKAIAILDILLGFSEVSLKNKYIFPDINDGPIINITGGRHPVISSFANEGKRFVPNDTLIDSSENQLIIITGPNMAGKSTYIRQVTLLTLMAQIGCGIPAEKAEIGVVDRIFTRVGASDDIARGHSTFMVEMNETAYILNNATPKSLIVLDEIGRGTSTFDGISIAWAVVEYLVRNQKQEDEFKGPKTLFATHYHELTRLADSYSCVKNFNISVKEWNDEIIFLYKILPGSADRSYGIHVARLAGLPYGVLERAKEILCNLEDGSFLDKGAHVTKHKQMFLFDTPANQIVEALKSIKLEYITPIEALNKLKELKERLV